jgi:hypothetical protein
LRLARLWPSRREEAEAPAAALERAALERAEQEPARLAAVAAEVAEDHRRRKLKISAAQARL